MYRRQKSENIIRSLVAGATEALLSAVVTGSASGHCLLSGMDSVLKDVISPLVDIVSPCYIRPLPMTSLNPHEKEIITGNDP